MTSKSDDSRPPRVTGVELIQDVSRLASPVEGFLRRHRHRVKTSFDNGTRGELYMVDYVDRAPEHRDAGIVVVYAPPAPGQAPESATLLLRQQLRYPVYLVQGRPLYLELIAGVLESPEPLVSCAVREVYEEAGIEIRPEDVKSLGPAFYPMPSAITERIHPACVAITREVLLEAAQYPPPGDGSPFEEGAELVVLELGEALALIDGRSDRFDLLLDDAKTEICLRRLWARLAGRST